MTKKIRNFSRHPFNADQKLILTENGFEFSDEVIAPFFTDGADFLTKVNGTTASVVVPSHILLEALSLDREFNFSILCWEADADARKRGAFAVRGLKVSHIRKEVCPFADGQGIYCGRTVPQLNITTETLSANFQPTIENNFASNEAKPYGG
jgi:hypothetical protein